MRLLLAEGVEPVQSEAKERSPTMAQVSDLCLKQQKFLTSSVSLYAEVINFDCSSHKSETCASKFAHFASFACF